MIRVLHFSDVHIEDGFEGVSRASFLNKRIVGYGNLMLRRRTHFKDARAKLAALAEFMREQAVDLALCTGDYTALGTDPELALARETIGPFTTAPLGLVTVPGNHDIYVDADGAFERHFGDVLRTDWPEHAVDGVWPQVRLFGEELAVIALNSARPNPQVFRSSGRIPDAQLEALRRVVADERLAGRFVFVATHYAPRLADGSPDRPSHGLENADELLAALAGLRRGAITHGHVHRCFHVRVPECPVPLFGAGSATQQGREGLWLFEIDAHQARAYQGRFADGGYSLSAEPVTLA